MPALRTRGVNLAVVTLGLGVAVNAMVFQNVDFTGGSQGTVVGDVHLFGYDITALNHPERYAIFALLGFVVAAIAFRIGLRRLPFIRAMARHIDAAKAQAKAQARAQAGAAKRS